MVGPDRLWPGNRSEPQAREGERVEGDARGARSRPEAGQANGQLSGHSHAVEVARATWGTLLLTRPGTAARLIGGRGPHPHYERAVLRVLGLRHLAQAAVTAAWPEPEVVLGGAVSDALHALTGVGYATTRRARRRTGLVDAAVASGFGVATMLFTPVNLPAGATSRWARRRSADRQAGTLRDLGVGVAGAAGLAAGGWWLLFRSPLATPPEDPRLNPPGPPGSLRYRVPDHQDPSVLVAALGRAGYHAAPEWVLGANYLVISCENLLVDRSRVRSVLADTSQSSFSGPDIVHGPVVFEDEKPRQPA